MDLRLGDCLEIMESIKNESIDAVITDPPYGTTACKWDSVIDFDLMWEQLNRIIKPNGAIVLFGAEPFSSALRMSNINNYKYDWIWEKDRPSGHLNSKKQPLRNVENISVFYKKQCTYNPIMTIGKKSNSIGKAINEVTCKNNNLYGNFKRVNREGKEKYPRQILKYNRPHPPIHPTQKPVALMEYLIKTYTNEKETVLDFTMGSGTTGVAAKNLNRKFIGIEQDHKYFDIATERINKEETQKQLF
jgi:site-specific DNA-methyltransferase (adenine-specific)